MEDILELKHQPDSISAVDSNQLKVVDVTTSHMASRGHRSLVWDTTAFPTRSHYYPIMLGLIKKYYDSGKIDPSSHILVETTTGNAGSACAYVARELGFDVVIFMPEDMPTARIDDVISFMPESNESRIIFTEKEKYVQGMVDRFQEFYSENKRSYHGKRLFALNHSRRPEAVDIIDEHVSKLIDSREDMTNVDYVVAALGNGTTATGLARAFKRKSPSTRVVAIEPFECPRFYIEMFGEEKFRQVYGMSPDFKSHGLLGTGGWGVDFPHVDLSLIDDIVLVKPNEWQSKRKELINSGHAYGHSTAACQAVASALSKDNQGTPLKIFGMAYDPINKY
jgi:cysteine synthase